MAARQYAVGEQHQHLPAESYAAKHLTFLPESSILFMRLAILNHREVLYHARCVLGNLDSFSGHKSWGGLCVLFEKVFERWHPACPHRLCSRSDGGGIGMESADPGHGAGCRSGQAGVFPCSGGLLAGHPVFAAAGSSYSASAPE